MDLVADRRTTSSLRAVDASLPKGIPRLARQWRLSDLVDDRRPTPSRLETDIAAQAGSGTKKRPSMDPGPFRSGSLAPIAWIIGAVLAGAALLVYLFAPDDRPPPAAPVAEAEKPIPPPPPPPPKQARRVAAAPDGPNDQLGHARDFKTIYMRYRDSQNPIERALAGRAYRACFPAFLPPRGQEPSPVHVLNALPAEHRDERRAAVEAMFERCKSFLVPPLDMAQIVSTAERTVNGDLATPGASARWSMIRGDRAAAEAMVQQALNSKDPYAVQSLSGLSLLLANESSGGVDVRATDAALAVLACDLGAACGENSLLALQLCASEGWCEGTARERMVARVGAEDPKAVERERARLLSLLNTKRATISLVWRGGR
jgi:hypothetical protein